jgi:hypothetical protein
MITTTDAIIITIAIIIIAIINITITIIMNITSSFEYAHIHPRWVGNRQYILLANLSQRSALPKLQLSTIPTASKVSIVNSMVMRDWEIVSWGAW